MIKHAILIVGTMLCGAMLALTSCSTNTAAKTSLTVESANNSELAAKNYNSLPTSAKQKKNVGSLWNSELFNESRFLLDLKLTASEKQEAKRMAKNFEAHMEASSLFMYHLLLELKKRNLPVELAALPMVESGFNPRAKSHAGAHGPWQFIRSTGKSLGLERTSNYDEFYDFIESTDASLRYLEHLYRVCGENWDLAVAAYNQGEYTVKKAIRAAQAAGVDDINFNTVKLTKHGNLYVKRFHAYADILRHPENYGVSRPEIKNRPAFKRVQIAGRISSMQEAARLSGVQVNILKHLNAGYLSDSLQSNKPRGLLVPIDNAGRLEQAIGVESSSDSDNTASLSQESLSANRG